MANTESNPSNPAVCRCIQAYNLALEAERASGSSDSAMVKRAKEAFREAMPHLEDRRSIHDFIACIAYCQVNDLIWHNDAPKWLYSAQVALQALPPEPRPGPGRPSPSAQASAQPSVPAPALHSAPAPETP